MSARAEQLVLEYLSRIADEAHGVLRSDERLRFVTRVRAAIDGRRQAGGAWEPSGVRRVLAELGDPQALVRRERRRLDELASCANGAPGPGGPTAAADGNGAIPRMAPNAVEAANVAGAAGAATAAETPDSGTAAGTAGAAGAADAAHAAETAKAPAAPHAAGAANGGDTANAGAAPRTADASHAVRAAGAVNAGAAPRTADAFHAVRAAGAVNAGAAPNTADASHAVRAAGAAANARDAANAAEAVRAADGAHVSAADGARAADAGNAAGRGDGAGATNKAPDTGPPVGSKAAQARAGASTAKASVATGGGARPAAVPAVRWRPRSPARTPAATSAPASHWRRSRPPVRRVAPRVGQPAPRTRQHTASDLTRLARTYGREAAALVLLGPGGVLLPIPLWVIGALIALTSWAWTGLERVIGLGGPLVFTAAGIGVIGVLNKNPSMPIDAHAYIGAAQADGQLLLRIGAAAGALFLGARLLRRYRASMRRSAGR